MLAVVQLERRRQTRALLDERFDQVEKAYADSDEEYPLGDDEAGEGEDDVMQLKCVARGSSSGVRGVVHVV